MDWIRIVVKNVAPQRRAGWSVLVGEPVLVDATAAEAKSIAAELGAREWARTRIPHAVLVETDGIFSVLMTFGFTAADLETLLAQLVADDPRPVTLLEHASNDPVVRDDVR